jgi:hypothetical protein
MRGADQKQGSIYSYVTMERRIRVDHPARKIRGSVDNSLRRMDAAMEAMYASRGRPCQHKPAARSCYVPPIRNHRCLLENDLPPSLKFAFSQIRELFQGRTSNPEALSELFWASLHGTAELTRTKRFPTGRQKQRVRALVDLFSIPKEEPALVLTARGQRAANAAPSLIACYTAESTLLTVPDKSAPRQ